MHPDVGVCSIGYDELIAVLLLRQQREHAVQPAQARAVTEARRCGAGRACGMDKLEEHALGGTGGASSSGKERCWRPRQRYCSP